VRRVKTTVGEEREREGGGEEERTTRRRCLDLCSEHHQFELQTSLFAWLLLISLIKQHPRGVRSWSKMKKKNDNSDGELAPIPISIMMGFFSRIFLTQSGYGPSSSSKIFLLLFFLLLCHSHIQQALCHHQQQECCLLAATMQLQASVVLLLLLHHVCHSP
jgi:hypothetical protein